MSAAAALTVSPASTHGLVRVLLTEYTADSVADHPLEAARLDLVRLRDGNYARSSLAPFAVTASAAARSSTSVQAGLSGLTLGG